MDLWTLPSLSIISFRRWGVGSGEWIEYGRSITANILFNVDRYSQRKILDAKQPKLTGVREYSIVYSSILPSGQSYIWAYVDSKTNLSDFLVDMFIELKIFDIDFKLPNYQN